MDMKQTINNFFRANIVPIQGLHLRGNHRVNWHSWSDSLSVLCSASDFLQIGQSTEVERLRTKFDKRTHLFPGSVHTLEAHDMALRSMASKENSSTSFQFWALSLKPQDRIDKKFSAGHRKPQEATGIFSRSKTRVPLSTSPRSHWSCSFLCRPGLEPLPSKWFCKRIIMTKINTNCFPHWASLYPGIVHPTSTEELSVKVTKPKPRDLDGLKMLQTSRGTLLKHL